MSLANLSAVFEGTRLMYRIHRDHLQDTEDLICAAIIDKNPEAMEFLTEIAQSNRDAYLKRKAAGKTIL